MKLLGYKGIVVGDGDEKNKLEKEFPKIEFAGWKSNDEVKQYMKKAKALIFPSRWYEGAPLTPLECMQYGIPSLVSNASAAIDYVTNKELIFKLNCKDLQNKILGYEKNIKQYSKESLEFMKERRKHIYTKELLKSIERL